ncbi:hypothetical protein [Crossiella cryophila]|uniref:Tetratricopeptide (TPR) repeat protein n=1 Tax=Crossiella cryophila TaxID=43355 RepID=A0A7W7CD00_9PSEU|nr:hypothetical protein [Crossiella cryophila]MBB4678839.1 tetratricopeptide (TPR) repeat protein [Crossiella cryophila]
MSRPRTPRFGGALRAAACLALVVLTTATGLSAPPAAAAAPAAVPSVAPPTRCAFPVTGKIAQRWTALRGEHGGLGCPTAAEGGIPGRNGRKQVFERGEIATSPDHGPDMVVAAYLRGAEVVIDWGVMDGPEHRSWRLNWTHNGAFAGNDGFLFRDPRSGTFSTVLGQGHGRYEFTVEGFDSETHSDRGRSVPVGVNLADLRAQADCGAVQVVNGTHAQRWQELGGKDGIFACPKNNALPTDVFGKPEGSRQSFDHGTISTWYRQVDGKPWMATASAANYLSWVHLRWHSPDFYNRFVIQVKGEHPATYYSRPPGFDDGFLGVQRADGQVSFRMGGNAEVTIHGCRPDPLGGPVNCSYPVMQAFLSADPPRSMDLPGLTTSDPAQAMAKLGARQAESVRYYACYRIPEPNGADPVVLWPEERPGDDQGVHLAAMLESVRLFGPDFACPGQRPAIDLANEVLRNMRPHGTGTSHPGFSAGPVACSRRVGDYDTFLKSLMIIVYRHWDLLRAETRQHITGQLMTETGGHSQDDEKIRLCGLVDLPESENHRLMIEASKYLSNQVLLDQTGKAEFHNTGNGMRDELLKMLHRFAKFDLLEFNSRNYTRYSMQALFILHDFARDEEIRTAARVVLDYLTTKFSVSSNGMRRAGPFRRVTPNMDAKNKVYFSGGSDPQTPFFMLWTGFRPVDNSGEQDMWFIAPNETFPGWKGRDVIPEWFAHEAAIASMTWYLPPNSAIRTSMARPDQPYQVAYYHGERPRLSFANENAAGGVEIYAQSKSFTVTAGGMWLPSGYGLDEWFNRFADNENYAWAQATTLMPVRNHKSAPTMWENLIRFNGRGDLKSNGSGGWYYTERGVVNTCVQGGFACGLNLVVPKVWQDCAVRDVSKPNWEFLDLNTEACGKLGISVAIRSTVDSEMAGKGMRGNGGFFYAAESTALPFAQFVDKTHTANKALPEVLEVGKEHPFVAPDGKRLTFFLRTPDNSYHAPQVASVDGVAKPNWSTTPLAQGEALSATGHDGLLTLTDKACGSRTELDFRTELKPVVRANHGTCGLTQAEAALHEATRLWGQGKRPEAAAKGQESLGLLRQVSRDDRRATVLFGQWARSPIAQYLGDAEAISALREAVNGYRMLKLREPDQREHQAYEATLELDLGIRLYNAGDRWQGAAHTRTALNLVRDLAAVDRKYAETLATWGNWPVSPYLAATGQGPESLAVQRESRETYKRLVAEQPGNKELRSREQQALIGLGTRLWEGGDRPNGLAAVLEGVDLARKLATEDLAYATVFGEWLMNPASGYLAESGRQAESVTLLREAVDTYQRLITAQPQNPVHRYNKSRAFISLGHRLWQNGTKDEATARVLDGITLVRQLATADPSYRPTLAEWLISPASHYLDGTGKRPQAVEGVKEAINLYTALNATDPGTYGPKLAAAKRRLTELGG